MDCSLLLSVKLSLLIFSFIFSISSLLLFSIYILLAFFVILYLALSPLWVTKIDNHWERKSIQKQFKKTSKEVKGDNYCQCKVRKPITIWGAIEKKTILLLQWKIYNLIVCTKKGILYFWITNNIFVLPTRLSQIRLHSVNLNS